MNKIIVTTPEELTEIINAAVLESLKKLLPQHIRSAGMKPLLTKDELMELTGWSKRKVDYMKAGGKLPFNQIGRSVLFPTAEILEYINTGYVPAKRHHANQHKPT